MSYFELIWLQLCREGIGQRETAIRETDPERSVIIQRRELAALMKEWALARGRKLNRQGRLYSKLL